MQVNFQWRAEEWREAYLLCRERPQASRAGMNYLVLGVLALGGVGDIVSAILQSDHGSMRGTLLPLMLTGALVIVLSLYGLSRRRRLRGMPALPDGEHRLTLQEAGWTMHRVGAKESPLQPWSALRSHRSGDTVLAILHRDGEPVAVPLRVLTEEQAGWVHRLLVRKLAPAVAGRPPAQTGRARWSGLRNARRQA